ncbi:hypothetical protein ACHHYP_03971 [Achlya hypogyna]|uniref:Uncharacterized protein n=1 Tax=Achlya hypogyna TaxID=1202772 RepID=A0A1V9Z2G6_ACHHY|nr:hypothetical protein ACHHYP_03971 [Achlya hypogyna]
MLPLYKRGLHLVTLAKSRRHRRYAVFAVLSALLICVLLVAMYALYVALDRIENDIEKVPSVSPMRGPELRPVTDEAATKVAAAVSWVPSVTPFKGDDEERAMPPSPVGKNQEAPPRHWFARIFLPLIAGFFFGFLGSIPIAGPTSAMVLKMGIQGEYWAAQSIALGGATYAGVAFWGFGSFLAGLDFLLPLSKVLGAVMLLGIGTYFLRLDVRPPMDSDLDRKGHLERGSLGSSSVRAELVKNMLLGFTMSGFNPALLATYTGALASVYHTDLLDFTLFLALVFGVGVACGISTWFYILLSLLKKYKQRLKNQTIGLILRCMGVFLICLGLLCTKSAAVYFFFT